MTDDIEIPITNDEIPVQKNFEGPPIGTFKLFEKEEIKKLLAPGKFTFAGRYLRHEDGRLELIGLSLIPIEIQSTLSLLDEANQNGNLNLERRKNVR